MNLLKETIEKLQENGKNESDVRWVGNQTHYCDWSRFKAIADTEYDNGYGRMEVAYDLIIAGNDWWLERAQYDGSEWWAFKQMPKPNNRMRLRAVTRQQVGGGLLDINRY